MPLKNRLKEYRAKIDVNQSEFGKMVGVSRQTISQIERGDYSPSVTLALKIAKCFDANVEDVEQEEEEKDNMVWDDSLPCIEGTSFDIGGGGVRFRVDKSYEAKEMILCVLHLEIKGNVRNIEAMGKVLSTSQIKNSESYEVRVQFEKISNRDRELIIQYIFEDERRRRRQESGL